MAVEWRPGMSIDESVIDDDHRYLFDLINKYEDLMTGDFDREAIIKILNSLKYYTVYHFTREEAAQRAVQYPDHEQHAAEHKRLIDCVNYAILLLSREMTDAEKEKVKGQITRLLNNWLVEHIIKFDIPMRPYVKNMKLFMGKQAPISTI